VDVDARGFSILPTSAPGRALHLDRLEVVRLTLASVLTLVLAPLELGGYAGSVPRVFVGGAVALAWAVIVRTRPTVRRSSPTWV
jgi:hypothetical protein